MTTTKRQYSTRKLSSEIAQKILLPIFFLWTGMLFSQQLPTQTELLYATTDKPFYFEEERLLFQAAAIADNSFSIIQRNDILYADLLNEAGEKLISKKFLWRKGIANGEFELPILFEESTKLYLYLYTPSLVLPEDWVKKVIPVGVRQIPTTPMEITSLKKGADQMQVAATIFPDELFSNVKNQIFYSLDNLQKEGSYRFVLRENGKEVQTFSVDRPTGSFFFAPTSSALCTLELVDEEVSIWTSPLLVTDKKGLVVQSVDLTGESIDVTYSHNYDPGSPITFNVVNGAKNQLDQTISAEPGTATLPIKTQGWDQELVTVVTIKDEDENILAERLAFPPGFDENIKWLNQRGSLPAGSTPNLLFVTNADSSANSVVSVKLTDKRYSNQSNHLPQSAGQFFQQNLLRKSGIASDQLPRFFSLFDSSEKEAWVLTHPSSFNLHAGFPEINENVIEPDPFVDGFKITGRLTMHNTGQAIPYCPLALANTTDFSIFRFAKTDPDGYFSFDNLRFRGENELYLALQSHYEENVDIVIDQPSFPKFDISMVDRDGEVQLGGDELVNEALERSIVDSVYSGTSDVVKIFTQNNFVSKIAGFFLEPTAVVDPTEYVPFSEMKDVFKEILPSAYLRFKKGKVLIRMTHNTLQLPGNAVASGLMDVPALVIIDGVPIFNQEEVLKINPSYVAKYELYHGLFTLGNKTYLGLVHIVTNVDYLNQTEIKGLHKFKAIGVSPSGPVVIGPRGEPNSPYLSPVAFWVTRIKPDEKGVLQLPIRLTSVPGEYWLTLETMTSKGGAIKRWPLTIE